MFDCESCGHAMFLYHVWISLSSRLSGACGGVEMFAGRHSVPLDRSGLRSVVSSEEDLVSISVM